MACCDAAVLACCRGSARQDTHLHGCGAGGSSRCVHACADQLVMCTPPRWQVHGAGFILYVFVVVIGGFVLAQCCPDHRQMSHRARHPSLSTCWKASTATRCPTNVKPCKTLAGCMCATVHCNTVSNEREPMQGIGRLRVHKPGVSTCVQQYTQPPNAMPWSQKCRCQVTTPTVHERGSALALCTAAAGLAQ